MFGSHRVGGITSILVPINGTFVEFFAYGDPMSIEWKLRTDGIEGFVVERAGEIDLKEPVWHLPDLRDYLAEEYFKNTPLAVKLFKKP